MADRTSLDYRAELYAKKLELGARDVSPTKPALLMLEAASVLREVAAATRQQPAASSEALRANGRDLHLIITACPDLWDGLTPEVRRQWCADAEQLRRRFALNAPLAGQQSPSAPSREP